MTIDVTRLGVAWRRFRGAGVPAPVPPTNEPIVGYTESGRAITWPATTATTASHILCLGASGSHKTTMCASATVAEIAADHDRQLTILANDPKGDLCAAIISGLAANAPDRLADL